MFQNANAIHERNMGTTNPGFPVRKKPTIHGSQSTASPRRTICNFLRGASMPIPYPPKTTVECSAQRKLPMPTAGASERRSILGIV